MFSRSGALLFPGAQHQVAAHACTCRRVLLTPSSHTHQRGLWGTPPLSAPDCIYTFLSHTWTTPSVCLHTGGCFQPGVSLSRTNMARPFPATASVLLRTVVPCLSVSVGHRLLQIPPEHDRAQTWTRTDVLAVPELRASITSPLYFSDRWKSAHLVELLCVGVAAGLTVHPGFCPVSHI